MTRSLIKIEVGGLGGGVEPLTPPPGNGRLLFQSITDSVPNSPSQLLTQVNISPINTSSHIQTNYAPFRYAQQHTASPTRPSKGIPLLSSYITFMVCFAYTFPNNADAYGMTIYL